jgi:hypothetical protein
MTYSRAPLFLLSYSLSCKALEVAISISFLLLHPAGSTQVVVALVALAGVVIILA